MKKGNAINTETEGRVVYRKIRLFGGLTLRDLVADSGELRRQLWLYEQGLIQGVQLLVGHPCLTPQLTAASLPDALALLPAGLELFIHVGAASMGVNFCCSNEVGLDICGVWHREGKDRGISRVDWNRQTLEWAYQVARIGQVRLRPWGVVHLGEMPDLNGSLAVGIEAAAGILKQTVLPGSVALETLYARIDRASVNGLGAIDPATWGECEYCWALGSRPQDMERVLDALGPEWRVLIDPSHLCVTCNQTEVIRPAELADIGCLSSLVSQFQQMPCTSICHWSGAPPSIVGSHSHFGQGNRTPPEVLSVLRQMHAICLELSWHRYRDNALVKMISAFREELN